jgi:CubicO group peptidase (beta-lactamase class C family)
MEQAIRVTRALGLLALVCLLMTVPGWAEDYPTADRDAMWSDPGTYMIGSFRHMGEIYPSRPVRRAGPVSDLPRGIPVVAPVYDDDGTTRALEDYFKRARVTGFIVLKRGKIVFERYRLGADEKSLFTSWSMAKSFVSTLVGFAVADGQIHSLDDPVSDYLPELRGSAYDGVPIKAVLQMSSGVAFTEDYVSSVSDSDRMWDEAVQYNKQPLTNFARDSKRAVAPFTRFNYVGVDTVVLGWLVSRVTGKTLAQDLSAKLWGPLGMETDADWMTDGRGPRANEIAFCCLDAALRDYARFGLFMSQGGAWQGRQLLARAWVEAATHSDRPQVQPGKLYPGYPLGYQYQWWVLPTGPDEIGGFEAQGIYGQFLYVNPTEQVVIVVASVWPKPLDDGLEFETYAVFDAFLKALK